MKKTILLILALAAIILAAGSTEKKNPLVTNAPKVYPTCYEGILLQTDTIVSSDSISAFNLSRFKLDVSGIDSAYVILQGKVYDGSFIDLGDTIKADGHFDRSTYLPLSYLRVRTFSKNDSGVTVRAIGTTF